MMQLKLLFSLFLTLNFGFVSPVAAANTEMQSVVDQLNYRKTLPALLEPLKDSFKTQEDHRQIDAMIDKLEKQSQKWMWRFELNKDDSISLRMNGKVQWTMKGFDPDGKSFSLNGQKVDMSQGTSFLAFHKKITDILIKKEVSFLESLLVQEAHAIAPLVIGLGALAAVGGALFFANRANANSGRGRCEIAKNSHAKKTNLANFHNQIMCRSYPGDYNRRITWVRDNFGTGSNSMFSTQPNTRYPYRSSCTSQYSSMGDQARAFCRCVYRKQLGCQEGGWNMKPQMAVATCQAAYDSAYCEGPPKAKGVPPKGKTPYNPSISGDRPGIKPKTGVPKTQNTYYEEAPPTYEVISPTTPGSQPKTEPQGVRN